MKISPESRQDFINRLDPLTKKNLDAVVERRLNNDYDYMLVIVGKVGDGKSQLAQLMCAYVDPAFNTEKIIFTALDYRAMERRLHSKSAIDFDEAEEVFYSRGAMSSGQKKMILKFAQIRQKNHFIVLCAPSLGLLEKWLRGVGDTRVNAIFKVERRGMFKVFGDKSGAIGKIRFDKESNMYKYPEPDFIGFWQKIPEKDRFWTDYKRRKERFLSSNRESAKIQREREKIHKLLSTSLSVKDISEIHQVSEESVRTWFNYYDIFPKGSVFKDIAGHVRVTSKGYDRGMAKLMKIRANKELLKKYRAKTSTARKVFAAKDAYKRREKREYRKMKRLKDNAKLRASVKRRKLARSLHK